MLSLEDPLTGDFPTRYTVEEDEQLAVDLVEQYIKVPDVKIARELQTVSLAIFFIGSHAVFLREALYPEAEEVGEMRVPALCSVGASPHPPPDSAPLPPHRTSLHLSGSTLLLSAPAALPDEQAVTWAVAALDRFAPRRLVVCSTMPARHYRGSLDPAYADVVHSLGAKASARGSSAPLPAPSAGAESPPPTPLPCGTLVGGVAAALLSLARARGVPQLGVVGVEHGAKSPSLVAALARGANWALGELGEGCRSLAPAVRTALREAVESSQRVSADSHMFA